MSATDADAVHGILPGGSVELRVADPADGGRRLFVRAPIKAGDEILSLNPYAAVLNDAWRTSRCDHTFAKPSDNGGSLLRCARSKVARYVSRDAQVAAWKRGYKEECASLVNCAPRVPPATVRLAARVLWRRAREAAAADGSNDDDDDDEMIEDGVAAAAALGLGRGYDAVDALGDHWERLSDSRKASLAHVSLLAAAYHAGTLGSGSTTPSPDDPDPDPNPNAADPRHVARLLAKISCNAHTVCDEELNAIGVAVYPAAAMVNHADAPTAVQSFKGKKIVLRATRDLKRGDEVTMAYVELLATRQERRAALRAGYSFDIDGTDMATYCPHASPDRVEACEANMRNTFRTRLPGGAVLVDHGEGSDSPPWRTGHADPYLCAVEASRKKGGGIVHGGVEVVTRPMGTGRDDGDDGDGDDGDGDDGGEKSAPGDDDAVDYSGGLGGLRGSGGFGRTFAEEAERAFKTIKTVKAAQTAGRRIRDKSRFEVHVWGTLGGAAREQTGMRVARCASLLAEAELRLAEGTKDGVEAALKPLAQISDLMNGDDAACALGPIHLLRVRVLDAMQRAAVTAGDFESARDAARAVLPAYRLAYPPCHPPLGLHLALIAKIEAHLVDLNAAVQFAREAISCLNVSHGRNSDVVRMMETLLGESEAELRYNEYNRSGGNEDAETGEGYLEAYE